MTFVALVSLVTSFSAHEALELGHFLFYLVATFTDSILLLAIPLILAFRTFLGCFPSLKITSNNKVSFSIINRGKVLLILEAISLFGPHMAY